MSKLRINELESLETGRSLKVDEMAQTFDYEAGIKITSYSQMVRDDNGEFWRVSGQVVLPYVTTGAGIPEGDALVLAGDVALRQDLANPDMGAALVGRGTVSVESISDLLALPPSLRKSDLSYIVAGYWPEAYALAASTSFGGGTFKWYPVAPKSSHNGGTIIDPEVTWDGSKASHTSFLGGSSSGEGCFVRVLNGESVSISDFGAIGDNNFDCYASIQSALDNSKHVVVPEGSFKYTQTPDIPPDGNLSGFGIGSVLRPHSCDGIKYISSDLVGSRFLRDLHIYAHGGEPYAGIVFDSGRDDYKRTTGVVISNIYIAWFGEGVNAKGLWHSSFRNVVINNCIHGMILRGHCVSVDIGSCKIQTGGMSSTEDRYGIRIRTDEDYDGESYRRPEAIKIHSETLVFGFDYGVYVHSCLNFSLSNSDIDYSIKRGVQIRDVTGGCSIRDNWIAGEGKAGISYYGIHFENMSTDTGQRNVVSGNSLSMTGTPGPDCRGIMTGSLHGNVTIESNTVHAGFDTAVYIEENSTRNRVRDNTLSAGDALFIVSSGNTVSGNSINGALYLHSANLRNEWGDNEGALTRKVVLVPIDSGATTGTATLASLGLPSPNQNQRFYLKAFYEGSTSVGAVSTVYSYSDQTISVFTQIAVGVTISIQVEMVAV